MGSSNAQESVEEEGVRQTHVGKEVAVDLVNGLVVSDIESSPCFGMEEMQQFNVRGRKLAGGCLDYRDQC